MTMTRAMTMKWIGAGLALGAWAIAAAGGAMAATAVPETVYGADDRQEVASLRGPFAKDADSAVALVAAGSMAPLPNGRSRLVAPALGTARSLCPGQRFAAQPTAAFCSGVLVGPDLVVTAGHCVSPTSLDETRFVFGYRVAGGKVQTDIAARDIYRGAGILTAIEDDLGADYAVVRLDRPVLGHAIAKLLHPATVSVGRPVFIVGYPSGLPAKFAAGAQVLRTSRAGYLEANLDSFGGNSGSPVFDARTHAVVGILVRGEADYARRGACAVVNVLPNRSGHEAATLARIIAAKLPLP